MLRHEPLDRFLDARDRGVRAGVLLDVDGTLSPIVARPEQARLAPGARDVLGGLVPAFTVVAVISGRTDGELASMVAVPGVRLVGHYGMPGAADVTPDVLAQVERAAADIDGAWVERKGPSVAVHVRAAADPDAAERSLRPPLETIGEMAGLRVIEGKRVLELVPRGATLKGDAVAREIEREALEAVLYAGDDVADLAAFSALADARTRGILSVAVAVMGPESPEALRDAADLVVDGPSSLVELLRELSETRRDPRWVQRP